MTDQEHDSAGKEDHAKQASGDKKSVTGTPLPAINFATFVFSLNSSALVQLGMMEDPMTGEKEKNLPLAKQTIDIISMLEEKTRGNLEPDEAAMLKNILYDLRILYVKEKS
jgi:hypothetical protein